MSQRIINGDSAEVLKTIESNTIDAVITDPPYGIEFLGKEWDSNTGAVEIWQECLRVLKPGGHLLAFSAARTYHILATNIQASGFEIRDQIMWLYASGFPKAQDIGRAIQKRQGVKETKAIPKERQTKTAGFANTGAQEKEAWSGVETVCTSPEAQQWAGWKTALKPAHEPIVMARKPFRGSTIDNVLEHGVGALNIDATRIASEPFDYCADGLNRTTYSQSEPAKWNDSDKQMIRNDKGRFPSNVIGEVAGYQKFFYSPKVSRRERHKGFEQDRIPDPLENYSQGDVKNHPLWDPSIGTNIQRLKHKILEHNRDLGKNNGVGKIETGLTDKNGNVQTFTSDPATHNLGNNHPTVKPVELMKYLVKLVTAEGAHIIDPFSGSGSTGMACKELGRSFTGIDVDPGYCEIARRRIAATQEDKSETLFE